MKRFLFFIACALCLVSAQAQIIVVKAGADGKVFEPQPLTLVSPLFTTALLPSANDGAALGSASLGFSDLFLASGAVLNFANSNVTVTHSSGILTLGTSMDLRLTTAGTNAASVATVGGTQTLTNKTLTAPSISAPVLSGTATGTYTLAGTPTITAPAISAPVLSGTATGTYTLAGAGTLTAPTINAGVVNPAITDYTEDGAVALTSGVAMLGKAGSAGAYTIAAPGAAGKRITFTTTTDFAHVVTFTGGTLWDGTANANTTWTSAAVQGSSLTVVSVSATKWNVESLNLGTVAE